MKEVYFDDPETFDWEKIELLDQISVHDEEWKIETRHTEDGVCYDLEAVGSYSCGELVDVSNIEVKWASGEHEL